MLKVLHQITHQLRLVLVCFCVQRCKLALRQEEGKREAGRGRGKVGKRGRSSGEQERRDQGVGVSRAGAGESREWQAGKEGSGEARDKTAQATVA